MNILGKRIFELRKERGLRQSDLGELIGMSPSAVGMFESVMCGILLITFNYIARKRNGTSIW